MSWSRHGCPPADLQPQGPECRLAPSSGHLVTPWVFDHNQMDLIEFPVGSFQKEFSLYRTIFHLAK